MLKDFLKAYKGYIIWYFITAGVFLILPILYRIYLAPALYGLILVTAAGTLMGILAWIRFKNKLNQLKLAVELNLVDESFLPCVHDKLEEQYQELIRNLEHRVIAVTTEAYAESAERSDYYSLWVHQIKTPISALKLLLQTASERSVNCEELYEEMEESSIKTDTSDEKRKLLYTGMEQELFKIEQYAELVLSYLRIEKMTGDLHFTEQNPFYAVKEVVKKYSVLFIYKKISLQLETSELKLLTDKKWLSFLIEQLVSNALKYTPSGGRIRIYWEKPNLLVVEDSGTGIRAEDLSRVFERGYTGFNGRVDAKATGMGLYLSKKVADKIGLKILLKSEQGVGTKAIIVFSEDKIEIF